MKNEDETSMNDAEPFRAGWLCEYPGLKPSASTFVIEKHGLICVAAGGNPGLNHDVA